ncbi:MAG: hypothetical protein LBV80_07800 [Deltaproteobacteria bacterium]|jgi:hypothetical protein|nr:hypothetical protein [Deltaproteobacteria bacterium]
MYWWESLLGRPWERVPNPPQSFTCGELVRYLMKEHLGIEMLPVYADAGVLRECVDNLNQPEMYGLEPVAADDKIQPFDIAFLARCKRFDHVGLAVPGPLGVMVMHCQQGIGVVCDTTAELNGAGFRRLEWFRHKDANERTKQCRV